MRLISKALRCGTYDHAVLPVSHPFV